MDAIDIAGSALNTHQAWLNAISDNIANINTAKPTSGAAFQAEYLQVSEQPNNGGVAVTKVVKGDATGRLVYDPTNAVADKSGYVRMPDIDLGEQMSTLIMAQRGYQANAAVVDRAKTSYEAALQIGQGLMTSITALSGINSPTGVGGTTAATQLGGIDSTSGTSFSSVLGGVVDNLSGLQSTANTLAVKAVTGDLTDIHQATLAATRAQVTMDLVSAVRNKGIDAFNSIMNMQA